MAILKIRDADGNIQEILAIKGNDGKDYVLTDADKQEIAAMVSGGSQDLSMYALKSEIPTNNNQLENGADYWGYTEVSEYVLSYGFQNEDQVLALIQANMPASAEEVDY